MVLLLSTSACGKESDAAQIQEVAAGYARAVVDLDAAAACNYMSGGERDAITRRIKKPPEATHSVVAIADCSDAMTVVAFNISTNTQDAFRQGSLGKLTVSGDAATGDWVFKDVRIPMALRKDGGSWQLINVPGCESWCPG